MPDQPASIPAAEPVYWDLKTVARITGRPLKVIQRWVAPGPNGESPILPSIKESHHPFRRLVSPEDLVVTTRRRQWGTEKTGNTTYARTTSGRLVPMTDRVATNSRWPDES